MATPAQVADYRARTIARIAAITGCPARPLEALSTKSLMECLESIPAYEVNAYEARLLTAKVASSPTSPPPPPAPPTYWH